MLNFENSPGKELEQESSPAKRLLELAEQIEELKSAQKEAIENLSTESVKKQKKQPLQKIELPGQPAAREIEFVKDDKGKFHFEYFDKCGNKIIAMPGDLIADLQWGIYYDLNHEIKSSDHRGKYNKFRKQYLAAVYQVQIDKLETERLLIQRLKIDRVDLTDYYLGQIYQELYNELRQGRSEKEEQAGFIFEKMISGLLIKIAVDLGEHWNFSVARASVIDDVELKTDLLVKFLASKRGDRGVGAGENDTVKGFQLTLVDKNDKKWQRKKEQVQKIKQGISRGDITNIDDLVLLETEVGNQEVLSRYKEWQDRGQFAGGPENLFSLNQIMEFMAKIFEQTDLDLTQNKSFSYALNEYFEKSNLN
jgi:hypothetical protein